jgi:hypothetical protein
VGLGAFHGANPAMGWLFAVALGMHRRSRAVVLLALVPIAAGHLIATAGMALLFGALGLAIDQGALRIGAGALLIGWAGYHHLYGSRHRTRVGMRTGMVGLALWSCLMATAHGAGLMLVPVLLAMGAAAPGAVHAHAGASLTLALGAAGIHTLAMLVVTGVIALVVYDWVGLAFLRRGWLNLDRLWTASLVATGAILILLVPAGH